ncbi:NAD(P)-binding protein, partial [Pholiota conissans]
MSQSKIYLVAGATRGIGLALVEEIASKDPFAFIYAGARTPTGLGAAKLQEISRKYPGRIEIVKYVAGDKEENEATAKIIREKHGRLDVVIANAGISNSAGQIHEIAVNQFTDHFSINVVGPIVLFQAVRELLKASSHPRFIPISSAVGSIELISTIPIDGGAYGASKAALNWITRKIHFENDWLVAFSLCPGSVNTDMANNVIAIDKSGNAGVIKAHWREPNVAAGILVDIIVASTREKDGGVFNNVEGTKYP